VMDMIGGRGSVPFLRRRSSFTEIATHSLWRFPAPIRIYSRTQIES